MVLAVTALGDLDADRGWIQDTSAAIFATGMNNQGHVSSRWPISKALILSNRNLNVLHSEQVAIETRSWPVL